jgi:hypothetical protein
MRRTLNYSMLLNVMLFLALSLSAIESSAQETKRKTPDTTAPASRAEQADKQAQRKQLEKRMLAQPVGVTNAKGKAVEERRSQPATNIQPPGDSNEQGASLGPDCDSNTLLLQFTVGRIFLTIDDYAHRNTTVYYETRQTAPPTLVFSLTPEGSYTNIVSVPVALDANGFGQSDIFYVMGTQLGSSTFYGYDVASDSETTTITYTVLPQCNCPPIPLAP